MRPIRGSRLVQPFSRAMVSVYTGCNIENASYGLTICAERVALFNAVASGAAEITALAVYSNSSKPASPCGACRQVAHELARGIPIVMASVTGQTVTAHEDELLHLGFEASDLASAQHRADHTGK